MPSHHTRVPDGVVVGLALPSSGWSDVVGPRNLRDGDWSLHWLTLPSPKGALEERGEDAQKPVPCA